MKLFVFIILSFGISSDLLSQENVELNLVENYNNWGWDSWVMQNGLITITTVPVIGARIMQFDLGGHPSIFINPEELGKTYTPQSSSGWPNFGGFKNWPAPQNEWNWPPPPTLDFGLYNAIATPTQDSVSLEVVSPIEQWRTPNLQFKRKTTIYNNSSRVKVQQTIINVANTQQDWSIWDVTQHITNHPGETDFENFRVYFPINPESEFGSDGVRLSAGSNAWLGEITDGIYGVQFLPESKKIFADSHLGWIAYVDERDGYVYAKTFGIDDEASYPDDGARVEVWINADPYYLEVEVLSPIISLAADSGKYTFTENWWAAKIENGPILSVNQAGVVTQFEYLESFGRLSGSFGVFHDAFARLEYLDESGSIVTSTDTIKVTPLERFVYDEPFSPLEGVVYVRMVLLDIDLNLIGVLVLESIETLLTSNELFNEAPNDFQLSQNYPNPFNPSTNISYTLPIASDVTIEVFNMLGQSVGLIESSFKSSGNHITEFDGSSLSSGIYIYRIEAGDFVQTRRMVLAK